MTDVLSTAINKEMVVMSGATAMATIIIMILLASIEVTFNSKGQKLHFSFWNMISDAMI